MSVYGECRIFHLEVQALLLYVYGIHDAGRIAYL